MTTCYLNLNTILIEPQGSKFTFLLGSTGAPNFKKLGAPQMFYEHPLNIKEQHNRQLSGRAGNILPDD